MFLLEILFAILLPVAPVVVHAHAVDDQIKHVDRIVILHHIVASYPPLQIRTATV
jgi:hypothetical protein